MLNRPENSPVIAKGFGNRMLGTFPSIGKLWVAVHGPPVAFKAMSPGHTWLNTPKPRRTTVVASARGRIANPKRGLQLLASFSIRLRIGNPACEAGMMGRVAATAGTKSVGIEVPAVTKLPVLGSKPYNRSNLSTQGVWYS